MKKDKYKELNEIANNYHLNSKLEDSFIENLCQRFFLDWLISYLPNDEPILELGYGDGVVANFLLEKNIDLTVIEGSSILVNEANLLHPNLKCIHTLFEDYKTDTKFNTILLLHILEHVDQPVQLLRHLSSLLSDTGKLIIAVPNSESIHRKLALIMNLHDSLDTLSERDVLVGHKRVYSHNDLLCDISESGFKEINFKGFFLKVLPNSMMLDYPEDLILALNEISNSIPPELCANIVSVISKLSR